MNQILVIDVETPNRFHDRICSIGLIVLTDGLITNSFHYLINPETEFDQKNIAIHGIRPIDIKNAPTFPEIWSQISALFNSSLVGAYNAAFDLSVLGRTLYGYGIGIEGSIIQYICALQMARHLIPDADDYSLSTLCNHSGIELHHHDASSDSNGCALIIQHFLKSGIAINDYVRFHDFADNRIEKRTPPPQKLSLQNQAINSLKEILSNIMEDNILEVKEVFLLHDWLLKHRELDGNYPYDKIFISVSNALIDGILETHEIDYLHDLFKHVFDPVSSVMQISDPIVIINKNIVLTGDFERGHRTDLEIELKTMGAICQSSVNKKTDYVIVGGQGSAAWSAGNYGNKVKKALELQESGSSIQIIREADFYSALGF